MLQFYTEQESKGKLDLNRKITDSWINLLPVLTTPIGAEGLFLDCFPDSLQVNQYYEYEQTGPIRTPQFGGSVSGIDSFCEKALELTTDKIKWNESINIGIETLRRRMSNSVNTERVQSSISRMLAKDQKSPLRDELMKARIKETMEFESYLNSKSK